MHIWFKNTVYSGQAFTIFIYQCTSLVDTLILLCNGMLFAARSKDDYHSSDASLQSYLPVQRKGAGSMGDAKAIRKWCDSNTLKYKVSYLLRQVS